MSCMCDAWNEYRCLDCEWFLMDNARDYTKKLGLTCDNDTLLEMIDPITVEIDVTEVDVRSYVWDTKEFRWNTFRFENVQTADVV